MAERILGIELAPGEVRLAVLTRQLRKLGLAATYARSVQTADPEALARALGELREAHDLSADTVAVGIPAGRAMLRQLAFPFTSTQKIAQVMDFELESQLPVPVQHLHTELIKTFKDPDGQQHVLVGALPKSELETLLDVLRDQGLDPDVVDLTGCALSAAPDLVALPAASRPTAVYLLLGLGSSEILYLRDGAPWAARTLDLGAPLGEGARPENSYMDQLAHETVRLVLAAHGGSEAPGLEHLILCGPGARAHGVATGLAQRLGLEVDVFEPQLEESGAEAAADPNDFAGAICLAARAAGKGAGFNFRSGAYAGSKLAFDWRRHAVRLGVIAGLLLLGWGVSAGVDIYLKRQELAASEARVREIVTRVAPDIKGTYTRSQMVSIVKTRIADMEREAGENADTSASVVELLRQLSSTVPGNTKITIQLISVDWPNISISASAPDFKTVEDVKKQLEASGTVREVTIKGAKADPGGKAVSFRLEIVRADQPAGGAGGQASQGGQGARS